MISKSALASWENGGLITNFPSMRATLTSEIGHSKGTSETAMAAEAANPARESAVV
jgi:hypothetical protein